MWKAMIHGMIVATLVVARRNEVLPVEALELVTPRPNASSPSSHEALPVREVAEYPDDLTWCNTEGRSFCTSVKNQHIPQYCGACWAFATTSALQDRIKIARKDIVAPDIILSAQHVLNCGGIGSCNGGNPGLVYQWLWNMSTTTGTGLGYESGMPYAACSSDSKEGVCQASDWSCTPLNVARTCGGATSEDGPCVGLSRYPNVTILDHGMISGDVAMMREIYHRGPIACGIYSDPILNFDGGIVTTKANASQIDHVIEVVGWGTDETEGKYWIVKNSWGEYWGEFGFFKSKFGALSLGHDCYWATPGEFTAPERRNQFICHEDGSNCQAQLSNDTFVTIYS